MNPPQSESIPRICFRAKRILSLLLPDRRTDLQPRFCDFNFRRKKLLKSETDPLVARACLLLAILRCELIKLQADCRVKCMLHGQKDAL